MAPEMMVQIASDQHVFVSRSLLLSPSRNCMELFVFESKEEVLPHYTEIENRIYNTTPQVLKTPMGLYGALCPSNVVLELLFFSVASYQIWSWQVTRP